ncbi:MAG: shikimate kinase [Deltaproteobacteria bacterium]|nr:shikimate kinase [Deltaproteobacteria bacterium]
MTKEHANIALTGFMAAGKTVVGRSLARCLEWPFVDLDAVIEAGEGTRVREIFARRGEAYFREREKAALGEVLDGAGQVIALGGGAVVDPDSRARLKDRSLLVWLRVSPLTVLDRTRGSGDRPLLQGGGAPPQGDAAGARATSAEQAEAMKLKRIEELSAQRESIYAQAHLVVDTDDLTVEQVVQRIRQQLCRP